MSMPELTQDRLDDTTVIPEPEQTTPSPETLKAKAELFIPQIAGKKDGDEFCEAVYLEDEGGYAFRRVSRDNSQTWRYMRTQDFESNFHVFAIINMTPIREALTQLDKKANQWQKHFQMAIKAMGGKSRRRLESTIGKSIFENV